MLDLLNATSFILRGPIQDGQLAISLTRYKLAISDSPIPTRNRLSLVMLHGISMHKETWLPTIERLAQIQQSAPTNLSPIEEAWVMDAYNHGEAAILNDEEFVSREARMSAHEWSRAVELFLKSGLTHGTHVIGIGHSGGACVISLSTSAFCLSELPFSALILIDPLMTSSELSEVAIDEKDDLYRLITLAKNRRDTWPSRAAAYEWLSCRHPYKQWDERVLRAYTEYALRALPTAKYPDVYEGVTLSCTREQEAAGYEHYEEGSQGLARLRELRLVIPIHFIIGEHHDLVSEELQDAIIKMGSSESGATTVLKIENAGHMVPQENPNGVAEALYEVLHGNFADNGTCSKL